MGEKIEQPRPPATDENNRTGREIESDLVTRRALLASIGAADSHRSQGVQFLSRPTMAGSDRSTVNLWRLRPALTCGCTRRCLAARSWSSGPLSRSGPRSVEQLTGSSGTVIPGFTITGHVMHATCTRHWERRTVPSVSSWAARCGGTYPSTTASPSAPPIIRARSSKQYSTAVAPLCTSTSMDRSSGWAGARGRNSSREDSRRTSPSPRRSSTTWSRCESAHRPHPLGHHELFELGLERGTVDHSGRLGRLRGSVRRARRRVPRPRRPARGHHGRLSGRIRRHRTHLRTPEAGRGTRRPVQHDSPLIIGRPTDGRSLCR